MIGQQKQSSLLTILVSFLIAALVCNNSIGYTTTAFQPVVVSNLPMRTVVTRVSSTTTVLNVFGNKKSKINTVEEAAKREKFWQGEWVCKDCGYIYNRVECAGLYFEEQGPGFRCPQCSGPRRRYAKKVGDVVGTTLDGGDAPILIFSFGGVIATIAFGIWAVNNL